MTAAISIIVSPGDSIHGHRCLKLSMTSEVMRMIILLSRSSRDRVGPSRARARVSFSSRVMSQNITIFGGSSFGAFSAALTFAS